MSYATEESSAGYDPFRPEDEPEDEEYLDSCQECGEPIPKGDVFCFDCARAGYR